MHTCRNVIVAVLLGLSFSSPSFALTRYVNVSNATPASPFTNWGIASTNIQTAIDAATSGDEILVAPGVYRLTGNEVYIPDDKTLMLRSTQSRAAIIDAQGLSQGMFILGTNSLVEGFTIRNGVFTTYGGGIAIGQACTVRDCLVTSNRATAAGGIVIYTEATNALVENCTIASNQATNGAGGGVVLYANSHGRLNHCVIRDNVSSSYAGGVWIDQDGMVSNCWIWGNQAISGYGGGVYMACAGTTNQAKLVNSVISGNSAAQFGGGVYSSGPVGTLSPIVNCTIVSNTAGADGGGVFAYTTRLINDIVYFNMAPTNADLNTHDSIHSCIISNCCTTTNYGWPCITNAPAFADADAGDFRLATASFCIDAGTTNGVPGNDIDGNLRPRVGRPGAVSTNCDMGAYEYGFHFNEIQMLSSNVAQFKWDIQDLGRYRLDISTNAASSSAIPVWNSVTAYSNAGGMAAGQFAEYTLTVTNSVPPIPSRALFRLRIGRSTLGK